MPALIGAPTSRPTTDITMVSTTDFNAVLRRDRAQPRSRRSPYPIACPSAAHGPPIEPRRLAREITHDYGLIDRPQRRPALSCHLRSRPLSA